MIQIGTSSPQLQHDPNTTLINPTYGYEEMYKTTGRSVPIPHLSSLLVSNLLSFFFLACRAGMVMSLIDSPCAGTPIHSFSNHEDGDSSLHCPKCNQFALTEISICQGKGSDVTNYGRNFQKVCMLIVSILHYY